MKIANSHRANPHPCESHERIQKVRNVATQIVATEAAVTTAELVSFPEGRLVVEPPPVVATTPPVVAATPPVVAATTSGWWSLQADRWQFLVFQSDSPRWCQDSDFLRLQPLLVLW